MISRRSLTISATALLLVASLWIVPFSSARDERPVDPLFTSDDDRWDDGFGFGIIEQDYARVYAIVVIENNVYVGGRFTRAGGTTVNDIARWDGSSWSDLGGGLDNCQGIFCFPTVYALDVRDKDLYVGGNFASIGGVPANRVALWDGSKWSSLGGGVQVCNLYGDCISVLSIAVTESEVYAGGRVFSDIYPSGAEPLGSFAKWNGSNWASLSNVSGASGSLALYAVAAKDKKIYVAGNFTLAGAINANHIAIWDGTDWTAMGSGIGCNAGGGSCTPRVYTIATLGDDVYAGGAFTSAGGVPANNIARWDGDKWTALGEGANGPVYKIAVNGNNIYVGGNFTSIGGVPANGIAMFDGEKWSALGSGVDGYVNALAFNDGELYVGGYFYEAGGKVARNFARWLDPAIVLPRPPAPPALLPKITGITIDRKRLTVTGEKFDSGAVILLNGQRQRTQNDEQTPTTTLIAKKSGRKIKDGDRLQVQNADGKLSPEFIATR